MQLKRLPLPLPFPLDSMMMWTDKSVLEKSLVRRRHNSEDSESGGYEMLRRESGKVGKKWGDSPNLHRWGKHLCTSLL